MDRNDFWSYLDRVVSEADLIIDRPQGASDSRYPDLVYPLDCGFLEKPASMDVGRIDFFRGTEEAGNLDALVLTFEPDKHAFGIRLLLGCLESEIQQVMDFLYQCSLHAWLVRRDSGLDLLTSRRSVRRFQAREVSAEILHRILEAATWAPSAHNRQPWRFVVLTTSQAKVSLAQAMGADFRRDLIADGLTDEQAGLQVERSRRRILEAPVAILLCQDSSVGDRYEDKRRQEAEDLMGVQGVALAGGYLLLAAHTHGLAGVWMCAPLFAPRAVKNALNLPEDWRPQALLCLGYPESIPAPRERKPLAEVVRFL